MPKHSDEYPKKRNLKRKSCLDCLTGVPMPKGKGKRMIKGLAGIPRDKSIVVRGTFVTLFGGASPVFTQNLTPLSLDSRLLAESDLYSEFRFLKASAKAWQANAPGDVNHQGGLWCAYTPAILSATPTTALAAQLPRFKIGNGQFGNPIPKCVVSGGEMFVNAPRWFRRGTPNDDLLELQGAFFIGTVTSVPFTDMNAWIQIDYVIEMRAQCDATLTAPSQTLATAIDSLARMCNAAVNPHGEKKDETDWETAGSECPVVDQTELVRRLSQLVLPSRRPPSSGSAAAAGSK